MKIREAEQRTGLTAKAIRLYEEKGLLAVGRKENAYRDYDEAAVARLQEIKLLREMGIGIPDIRLYVNDIISLDELVRKRKKEVESGNAAFMQQYEDCVARLLRKEAAAADGRLFDETPAVPNTERHENISLGLDLGTTTLSAVLADLDTGDIVDTYTVANSAWLESTAPDGKEQDAGWITEKLLKMVDFLAQTYSGIRAIGLSGQMHGIVYLNVEGQAVSPLFTWQDGRANAPANEAQTYCEQLRVLTGYDVKPGYGFATHFYNMKNGLVPADAVTFCTIADYAALRLTGEKKPLVHVSQAAALGLFDAKKNDFDSVALAAADIALQVPAVTEENAVVGWYRGIPVAVALGDNQAGVFGSLREEETSVLVNFGTGSQISVVTDAGVTHGGVECRPYVAGKCLLAGSALCGGKAYAMVEKFFRAYMQAAGAGEGEQYAVLNRLAMKGLEKPETLTVATQFCGTREDPSVRGGIFGLGEDNFTPEDLVCGVLRGMAEELAGLYGEMNAGPVKTVVTSGNAVRKNPALQEVIRRRFGAEIQMTAFTEEAAFGAALFAALAGGMKTMDEVKQCVRYL